MLGLSAFPSFGANSSTNNFTQKRILPKRLQKGNTIGLITPAAPVKKEQLTSAIEKLESQGFQVYYLPSVLDEYGYFAGKDEDRAAELMHMFENNKVDGIMCLRGGYGTSRILDLLDFNTIKQNPKPFIGYSDITVLNLAISQKTGLVTYHGIMGVSDFNPFAIESFEKVIMQHEKSYKYDYCRESATEENPEFDQYTITEGKARGYLTGGNLSLLASLTGTKYQPNFRNKLVIIEEVGEETHRVDKMLVQLIMGTNLKEAAGIILGVFKKCNDDSEIASLSLKQALDDLLKPLNIPTAYGLPFGHIDNKITIPMGIFAEFNAHKPTLKLLENPTS